MGERKGAAAAGVAACYARAPAGPPTRVEGRGGRGASTGVPKRPAAPSLAVGPQEPAPSGAAESQEQQVEEPAEPEPPAPRHPARDTDAPSAAPARLGRRAGRPPPRQRPAAAQPAAPDHPSGPRRRGAVEGAVDAPRDGGPAVGARRRERRVEGPCAAEARRPRLPRVAATPEARPHGAVDRPGPPPALPPRGPGPRPAPPPTALARRAPSREAVRRRGVVVARRAAHGRRRRGDGPRPQAGAASRVGSRPATVAAGPGRARAGGGARGVGRRARPVDPARLSRPVRDGRTPPEARVGRGPGVQVVVIHPGLPPPPSDGGTVGSARGVLYHGLPFSTLSRNPAVVVEYGSGSPEPSGRSGTNERNPDHCANWN